MAKRVRRWLPFVAVLCCATLCGAQQLKLAALDKLATKAYQGKDYAAFLTYEKQMLALLPGDPRTIYNVAFGEALNGHAAESVQQLERLLASKLDLGAETDHDLDGIRQSADWKRFEADLAVLLQPLVRSSVAFALADKGLIATGVAVDPQSGDTFVASARERKIIRRTKDGALSDFASAKDGLLGVWGLLIDPARKQLIASTATVKFMQGYQDTDEGKSGVCFFDLATGKLVRKVFLGASTDRHFLNAMALDKSGNLFVVDSVSAEIYRLRRSSSELELFVSSMVFHAPKGIALSADNRTLYVSDYFDGISALEVLSIDRTRLPAPENVWLGGLDGLAPAKDGFVAVQSGVQPNRVIFIHLSDKADKIASVETLESNHPAYAGIVQGTVSGGDFIYVANSQFAALDSKTGALIEDRARPTTVLRLPLAK